MSQPEKTEDKNFKLFRQMIKNADSIPRKNWETWQLKPEANFFMTSNLSEKRKRKKVLKSK